jgi:hypothetical protein
MIADGCTPLTGYRLAAAAGCFLYLVRGRAAALPGDANFCQKPQCGCFRLCRVTWLLGARV